MAHLHRTVASLRLFGNDLDPGEISKILGCPPTIGYRKGQVVRGSVTGQEITKRTGSWILRAEDQEPGDLDLQIKSILDRLPSDLAVWQDLAARFKVDMFCGAFMKETDEGFELSPASLLLLGARSIPLGICLYAPSQEESGEVNI